MSKGGLKGQRIKNVMCDDINTRRECVLKSLVIHLNEDPDSFFKEYLTSSTEDDISRSIAAMVMGIYTIRRDGIQGPEDVGVVIEGVRVLTNLSSVIMAFILPFGLIYALDLSFPDDLKYNFEFCQKIIMNLDRHKLNIKIQQLMITLFA